MTDTLLLPPQAFPHNPYHHLVKNYKLVRDTVNDPVADARPALAYAVAWLSVADGNSVLPPWVRHSFPAVLNILHRLREVDCGDADYTYCRANHDAVRHLQNFFNYPA